MSSEPAREPDEAYVWTWLPETGEPVVAGRVHLTGDLVNFNYGRSYLDRAARRNDGGWLHQRCDARCLGAAGRDEPPARRRRRFG